MNIDQVKKAIANPEVSNERKLIILEIALESRPYVVKKRDGYWMHFKSQNGSACAILIQDARSAASLTRNILETCIKEQLLFHNV